jgi:hypothetical protein
MFGLVYNPAKVHYEPMPQEARKQCRDFQQGKYWTFAHFSKHSAEYFVVLGVVSGQDGDSFGTAIEINGPKCQEQESKWILSGVVPSGGYRENGTIAHFPGMGAKQVCDKGPLGDCHYFLRSSSEEEILRGLVQDALTRGTHAWGSEAEFKKAVCSSSIMTDANSGYPLVQQELIKFCKQPK